MNAILRRIFTASLLMLPLATVAQTAAPRLNVDYFVLETPQPVYELVKGKIEVAEVFSYACPHCADASSTVSAWAVSSCPCTLSNRLVPLKKPRLASSQAARTEVSNAYTS